MKRGVGYDNPFESTHRDVATVLDDGVGCRMHGQFLDQRDRPALDSIGNTGGHCGSLAFTNTGGHEYADAFPYAHGYPYPDGDARPGRDVPRAGGGRAYPSAPLPAVPSSCSTGPAVVPRTGCVR